ncbi:MAG TPA: universal stress protein [Blastococcus sp.]|nr:universal stress protein [Blastococcus sp.]
MSAPPVPSDGAEDVRAGNADTGADPPAREIVVGVDGSECALGAVRWAVQEAARRDAPLRILHAATYLGRPESSGAPPPELPRARRITAQAFTVARHTAPGVQSSTEVVPADPVPTLLRAGAGAQLLVLGSSTTGAADELVLASVALRVAARSTQPVVVVPRQRTEPAGRPAVAVLGVGDGADDEAVALFAADAAQRSGVGLSVLQTRPPRRAVPSWVDDDEEWGRRFPDLEVHRSELPAARADHVLRATCPSPLLVISAGESGLLHRTLDNSHRWLLRHCTSPMALVPPVHRSQQEPQGEVLAPD